MSEDVSNVGQRLLILNHRLKPAPNEKESKAATCWRTLGSLQGVSLGGVCPLIRTSVVSLECDRIALVRSRVRVLAAA